MGGILTVTFWFCRDPGIINVISIYNHVGYDALKRFWSSRQNKQQYYNNIIPTMAALCLRQYEIFT